jgi:hypothetical protein
MHETLDPTDRLLVERGMRDIDRHELEHKRSTNEARHAAAASIRTRIGRRLIRLGSAIAAEPVEAVAAQRRTVRARAS